MDLYQFNSQNYESRMALVWQHGIFICFREEGEAPISLYDMGKFFAEVWYNADMEEIKMVIGFQNIHCLEPYLVDLKIEGIA